LAQVSLELIINGLTIAAGSALIVERFTEILKQVNDKVSQYLLAKDAEKSRQQRDEAAQRYLQSLADKAGEEIHDDFERYASVLYVPLTPVSERRAGFKLFVLIAPVLLGIGLSFSLDLHLMAMFLGGVHTGWLDTVLSGILIGGGSQPVHVLLRFLTTRKLTDEERQALLQSVDPAQEVAGQKAVPASLLPGDDTFRWLDISYEGGVKPETLENVHRRRQDPDNIVVHHTAMNSDLNFAAIVDEFLLKKKWLTGYHCVIMPDGSIRPFCRWDRTGNHAKGHNSNTLGVSFHGNFHSQPGDAWSNHDGRYGNTVPTEAQLHAGARLIALWRSLYADMPADVNDGVVQHGQLDGASTVCPGNQFPWQALLDQVKKFEANWQASPTAQEKLALFRRKPFLYVDADKYRAAEASVPVNKTAAIQEA
tara:strand:- start:998 stop:2266 length:1269 start_codon:yes stop_codon:yes gene_type:complete